MIINNRSQSPLFLLALMLAGTLYNCTPKAVSTEERFTAPETTNSPTIEDDKEEFFEEVAIVYKNLTYKDKMRSILSL